MEFKVKEVEAGQKSPQEKEQEIINKTATGNENPPAGDNNDGKNTPSEIAEENVLTFIKTKYNKEFTSIEDLFKEPEKIIEKEELPEDVDAFYKFKKETGRGLKDFFKVQEDIDSLGENDLLKRYLLETGEVANEEDANFLLEDEYSFDEEIDEESKVKRVKISRNKKIAEAKNYFNELKDKYKAPLESTVAAMSEDEKKQFDEFKQYINDAKTAEETARRKSEWFVKKTDEVFSQDFKGFDFEIGDQKITFNPGKAEEIKNAQLSPNNFIKKYLDDEGLISDAKGYHKALAVAMNPEKFAKFFFEQGQSSAVNNLDKNMKNIDMSTRKAPEVVKKGGFTVKASEPRSNENRLVIKSKS